MLAIETGRYKGIPRHDRICTRCTDNTVEDERHFLFSCNYHTQEREALMSIINENCNKGNTKCGVSPRLKIRPCDLGNQ